MKKLERSTKEYGGGGGRTVFEEDSFEVLHWSLSGGKRTELRHKILGSDIYFDGWIDFKTSEDCFVQFHYSEILEIMNLNYHLGYRDGEQKKLNEIRAVLGCRS